MEYKIFIFIYLSVLFSKKVISSTIGDHIQNQQEKEAISVINGQNFNHDNNQGEKINENHKILSENKSGHSVGAMTTGQFLNQDSNRKLYDDNKYLAGINFNHNSEEKADGVSRKNAHKKGHHSSGFRNSYHKDESSNNSSYFDDYNDEGDQSLYHAGRDRYGNEVDKRYDSRKENGAHYIQDDSKRGNFDRRGGLDSRNEDHHDYDKKKYLDDRKEASVVHRGQNFDDKNRQFIHQESHPHYSEHSFYNRPEYPPRIYPNYQRNKYDNYKTPYDYPVNLRRREPNGFRHQTITIYEDPRISVPFKNRNTVNDGSDSIHLDIRPADRRYEYIGNYYDPRYLRGNRRSEINPLVFNYNRY